MIEPEIAFAELSDNAALAEALLKYTFAALLNEREEDLAFFDQRIEKGLVAKLEGIVGSEFVHMDYGEAIRVLERSNEKFEFPVQWGVDLQSEHERYLTEKYAKKPVVVMNYPKAIKAFYMRVNDDGRTVAAMDVLAPGIGEIIGGSQREERLEILDRNMAERGIDREHTPGTATCAAGTVPQPASASASSAPSPTSPASPTSATPSPSRGRRGMRGGIEAEKRPHRSCVGVRRWWVLDRSGSSPPGENQRYRRPQRSESRSRMVAIVAGPLGALRVTERWESCAEFGPAPLDPTFWSSCWVDFTVARRQKISSTACYSS